MSTENCSEVYCFSKKNKFTQLLFTNVMEFNVNSLSYFKEVIRMRIKLNYHYF